MLRRVASTSLVRRCATDAKVANPLRMSTHQKHMLDLNGDGKIDFDDVKFAANKVWQARFWAVAAGTMFFAAFGGLNLFSRLSNPVKQDQKFFKWGGIYSRFHPEAGAEVSAKWGVGLSGPNPK